MTLTQYLKRSDAKSLSELSDEIGVSKSRLSQLRNEKSWPADLALKVEKATDGIMSANALSQIVKRARAA